MWCIFTCFLRFIHVIDLVFLPLLFFFLIASFRPVQFEIRNTIFSAFVQDRLNSGKVANRLLCFASFVAVSYSPCKLLDVLALAVLCMYTYISIIDLLLWQNERENWYVQTIERDKWTFDWKWEKYTLQHTKKHLKSPMIVHLSTIKLILFYKIYKF